MNKKLVELRNKSKDNIKNKLFEDYGKTWALTKEELEGESNENRN